MDNFEPQYKQDYSLDEIWQIRRAAGRPVVLSWSAFFIGLFLTLAAYVNPASCLFGLGLVLLVPGFFCGIVYSINYGAVSHWTRQVEARWAAQIHDDRYGYPQKRVTGDAYQDAR